MGDILPPDTILRNYTDLLRVKPPYLKSHYPYSTMDEETVAKTLKQIELVYQNLSPDVIVYVPKTDVDRGKKKGGGMHPITIFTM